MTSKSSKQKHREISKRGEGHPTPEELTKPPYVDANGMSICGYELEEISGFKNVGVSGLAGLLKKFFGK